MKPVSRGYRHQCLQSIRTSSLEVISTSIFEGINSSVYRVSTPVFRGYRPRCLEGIHPSASFAINTLRYLEQVEQVEEHARGRDCVLRPYTGNRTLILLHASYSLCPSPLLFNRCPCRVTASSCSVFLCTRYYFFSPVPRVRTRGSTAHTNIVTESIVMISYFSP